ncbi:MAG TPA: hypothetical protein VF680_16875 [Allosphingosinicella sp.]|jgi:hypothetical protein
MNGFILKDGTLTVEDQLWGLLPFKKILKRDKSRNKDMALKEMMFVFYFTDIKSDYLIISDYKLREQEIKADIELPEDWKIDDVIQEAIDFYESKTLTVVGKLYKSALKSANDISVYLERTGELLNERTDKGGTVTTLPMIVSAQKTLPDIMRNLKAAEKEVLRERVEMEGRMKGQQQMGMFEDGL